MRLAGIVMVILAAVFWGITGVIADILMTKGWSPAVISFYRGAIGLVCFAIWFLSRFKQSRPHSFYVVIWSILAGLGVAGNFTFYFISIEASSVAIAVTIMYTAPIIVLVVSFLFGLERSTWFKWGCIAVVIIGIFLLTGVQNSEASTVTLTGVIAALAAGVSYALFLFGFKNTSAHSKPEASLTFAFAAFCLVLLVVIDHREAMTVLTSDDIGWFVLLGLVGAGVSFTLYVIGIQSTTPSVASMIAMAEPVTASLLGVFVLGEHLTVLQLIGMILILVTITGLSVKQAAET